MALKKIGLYGGTFNPIHVGHLRSAEEVMEILGMDEILFVPSFNPPFPKRGLASFRHRLNMVKIAIRDNPSFGVSDIESGIPGKSFTAHTIEELNRKLHGCRLYFIMGADTFLDLPGWYKPDRLFALVDLVVMLRPPFDIAQLKQSPFLDSNQQERLAAMKQRIKISVVSGFKKKVIFLKTTLLDISATNIRTLIKKGRSVKYLLPQRVESYIISNKLYH
ncbi:nicotinate-nucleotide adenylyltransferase [bacterium BMS3Abin07]|nr:nicotinate-nucleotide adenylyltransferase [bacterium BMS3Abin07]GBE32898.1 nicotinate-nucleotide adenylyltransferase [bacterium BMS3Bbin05]HDO23200.1 nicotinate (nicotinamide) nucleotide adenylyltransferase [Nitrospirota bacterium]HDZ87099.1 nicotinate (nicotinamide) nucleotide adenylyltransferase [Nitrospirota bacterium]